MIVIADTTPIISFIKMSLLHILEKMYGVKESPPELRTCFKRKKIILLHYLKWSGMIVFLENQTTKRTLHV